MKTKVTIKKEENLNYVSPSTEVFTVHASNIICFSPDVSDGGTEGTGDGDDL